MEELYSVMDGGLNKSRAADIGYKNVSYLSVTYFSQFNTQVVISKFSMQFCISATWSSAPDRST